MNHELWKVKQTTNNANHYLRQGIRSYVKLFRFYPCLRYRLANKLFPEYKASRVPLAQGSSFARPGVPVLIELDDLSQTRSRRRSIFAGISHCTFRFCVSLRSTNKNLKSNGHSKYRQNTSPADRQVIQENLSIV